MLAFETALHVSVERARDALQRDTDDGQPQEVHRHAARLLDLLDRARSNGIETTGWVPASVLESAGASA